MSVNQNVMDTNPSFLDSNKKILFNINWDTSAGGARQLELDAFKCANSNINNVVTLVSPIDGSTIAAKTTPSLYFARTRLIKLIDVWNRILNSGLFTSFTASGGVLISTYKIVGANLRTHLGDYLFRNLTGSFDNNIDFDTINIFNRLTRFLVSSANNINNYLINNVSKQSLFVLTSTGQTNEIDKLININFNPTSVKFLTLMDELLECYKELISEQKLATNLFSTFNELTFTTSAGRTKIISLDAYKSNFIALAKIDESDLTFLNNETRALVQTWKDTNSNNIKYLYPQFATSISRNTESEAWSFRNVAIDSTVYNQGIDASLKKYQTKYLICSQLDMKRPLVFADQIINWDNPNDRPYVMVYNSGTYIYLPEEIQDKSHLNDTIYLIQTNPDYTITGGLVSAPTISPNTYAMEFTFATNGTTYGNYNRKAFGPNSSSGTYTNGLRIASDLDGNFIAWDFFGVVNYIFTGGYKNKTAKIRIENLSSGGSRLLVNDVVVSTNASQYPFTEVWKYSCSDANRYAPGVTISNLKYFYKFVDLSEQPDNQINLSAYFWKIGTSNTNDPNYNIYDDIKLKLPDGKNLYDIDKIDFLDNLTIYLKIN